ncbi:MAG TPA: CRISPR-associated endonuclease Cas2 [Gammaproteobacteria bacterium]|nr:CRISPR-associated endonuclease Cas2 [Gammaproteobacteria bacterium]
MARHFYLAAYDVADPKRLHRVLVIIKGYATGGQKSVYECWLSRTERKALLNSTAQAIHADRDRFFLLRMDPRTKTALLGLAQPLVDPHFYYQG